MYAGIHNEQEEGKDHGKYQHRTGSYEQSKYIKYCNYQNGASPKLDKSIFLQRKSLYVHPALPLTIWFASSLFETLRISSWFSS
jgi:hypothetical protein